MRPEASWRGIYCTTYPSSHNQTDIPWMCGRWVAGGLRALRVTSSCMVARGPVGSISNGFVCRLSRRPFSYPYPAEPLKQDDRPGSLQSWYELQMHRWSPGTWRVHAHLRMQTFLKTLRQAASSAAPLRRRSRMAARQGPRSPGVRGPPRPCTRPPAVMAAAARPAGLAQQNFN